MKHLIYLIAAMMLLAVGQTAQAAVYSSCDQWANYSDGTYTVWNNVWGATGSWSQCLYCDSATDWYIEASHTNGSQVKSYANTSRGVGQSIGNLSSFSSSMSTSSPGTGTYNISWDLWCPNEVMVWLARYGGAAPWGSYVTTASIGGRTWDVYKNGYPGFLTQSNTSGATVDMKAILQYCVDQGWLSSSNVVDNLGGGFEIWDTGGVTRTFAMNSFSASFSTGGSTSTTTTASSTSTTSGGGCTVTPYVQVNDGTWQQTTNVTVSSGDKVKFGPQPTSGGSWSWSGCGTSGSSREQTVYPSSSCSATATFSPDGGGSCSATFNVTVSGGTTSTTTTAASTSTTTTASSTSTTSGGSCTVTPYVQVNDGTWQQTTNVTVSSGDKVKFGPQPTSGGSWSWSGCGTSGSSREQTVYPSSSCSATATFSPDGGGSCSATFNVTVSGGTTSTTTTASSTSTTTTASSTSTTSGGSCDCGTCNWYGSSIPTCCESCSGWGWYDGGCRRSCVCEGSCP